MNRRDREAVNNVSATRLELDAAVSTFHAAAMRGAAEPIQSASTAAHDALDKHLTALSALATLARAFR